MFPMVTKNQVRPTLSANLASAITWVPFLSQCRGPSAHTDAALPGTREPRVVLPAATPARGQGAPESLLQVWPHQWPQQHQLSWAAERCGTPEQAEAGESLPWAPEERAAMVSPHISLHYQTMLPLTLRAWRAHAKTANLAASKEAREGF